MVKQFTLVQKLVRKVKKRAHKPFFRGSTGLRKLALQLFKPPVKNASAKQEFLTLSQSARRNTVIRKRFLRNSGLFGAAGVSATVAGITQRDSFKKNRALKKEKQRVSAARLKRRNALGGPRTHEFDKPTQSFHRRKTS